MKFSFILSVFAYISFLTFCSSDEDDEDGSPDYGTDTASDEDVLELKKQAIKILRLSGVEDADENDEVDSGPTWGDIQITESFSTELKKNFDEVQHYLENPQTRMSAPDFRTMAFGKWSMPIPYTVQYVQNSEILSNIEKAIQELQTKTCLKFQKTTNPNGPHIEFHVVSEHPGCGDSPLGKQKSRNIINIKSTCTRYSVALHEICHSLGFDHTQTRPDKDEYINIFWKNIKSRSKHNFLPFSYALKSQRMDYDFASIMHYSSNAFAINSSKPTMEPKRNKAENLKLMGHAKELSAGDVKTLNMVYCTAPKKASACSDSDSDCKKWEKNGYCDINHDRSKYVRSKCKFSCKACNTKPTSCSDFNIDCKDWAESGECKNHPLYMNVYCKASCKLC